PFPPRRSSDLGFVHGGPEISASRSPRTFRWSSPCSLRVCVPARRCPRVWRPSHAQHAAGWVPSCPRSPNGCVWGPPPPRHGAVPLFRSPCSRWAVICPERPRPGPRSPICWTATPSICVVCFARVPSRGWSGCPYWWSHRWGCVSCPPSFSSGSCRWPPNSCGRLFVDKSSPGRECRGASRGQHRIGGPQVLDVFAGDNTEQCVGRKTSVLGDVSCDRCQYRSHDSAQGGVVPGDHGQIIGDIEAHFPGGSHRGHGHHVVVVQKSRGAWFLRQQAPRGPGRFFSGVVGVQKKRVDPGLLRSCAE